MEEWRDFSGITVVRIYLIYEGKQGIALSGRKCFAAFCQTIRRPYLSRFRIRVRIDADRIASTSQVVSMVLLYSLFLSNHCNSDTLGEFTLNQMNEVNT